jgi:prepilin signal peptidase PulO-like enzyme (type II secretory pathway)
MMRRPVARRDHQAAIAGVLAAGVAFAAATLAHQGLTANGCAWAVVQLTLAAIAAYDIATRRIRNLVTVPGSLLAILLRAVFVREALLEVVLAGVIVFAAFLVLALVLRGGFGIGDAKLAGMLGFLLGAAVVPALLIGTVTGGVVGALVLARSRVRGATIAYGPYLAFGAAIAILVFSPPDLL